MWVPSDWRQQVGSFVEPVAPPSAGVCDPPLVCISINQSWLPYVLGALMQLVQPSTWIVSTQGDLDDVLARATDLIAEFGAAMPCRSDPPPCTGGGCATQACNISSYIATAIIHDVIQRIVQRVNNDNFLVNALVSILGLIPGVGIAIGDILKALQGLDAAINGPNLSHYEDALGDPTLFGKIACAIYGCISTDGRVTDGNFACIISSVGSVSYVHADVITQIALYLGQIGPDGLQAIQLPGVYAVYDCSGCPGGHATGPAHILPPDRQADFVVVTMAAGTAIAQALVTFEYPFTVSPVITVSTDEQDWIATVDGGSTVGFTATVKAAVDVEIDTTAAIFWTAVTPGIQ